jgi:hypothetical protein
LLGVVGPRPGDVLYWDGAPATSNDVGAHSLTTTLGVHHVRIVRSGWAIASKWVILDASQETLFLDPKATPCSARDLPTDAARAEPQTLPPGIECGSWARVRPAASPANEPTIEVSVCRHSACGPWLRWSAPREDSLNRSSEDRDDEAASWLWPTVIAGAAVTTLSVLWATGVFSRERPEKRVSFEFTGPNTETAVIRF